MTASALAAAAEGMPRLKAKSISNQHEAFMNLEDLMLRVKVMSTLANDHMQHLPASTINEQICHLVRATRELAEHLYDDYRMALEVQS